MRYRSENLTGSTRLPQQMSTRSSLLVRRIWAAVVPLGIALTFSLAALASTSGQTLGARAETDLPGGQSGVSVLRSDEKGLTLEVRLGDYQLTSETSDGQTWQRLTAQGFEASDAPGQPVLPVKSILIGVPPEGKVSYRILSDEVSELPGAYHIASAPVPARAPLEPVAGGWQASPDPRTYASNSRYPASVVDLSADAWLRDQRVARVSLYPFQYVPDAGRLILHKRLVIEIVFEQGAARWSAPDHNGQTDEFEPVLRGALLNYEQARQWRRSPAPQASSVFARGLTDLAPRLKITVDRDGLYRITYADLVAAGWNPAGIDPRTFHLTSQGQDVAIEVAGEADGQFDPGDYILFYGQKLSGQRLAALYADEAQWWLSYGNWQPQFNAFMIEKYTDRNVYWLTQGGTPGPRMTTVDGTPGGSAPSPDYYTARLHMEQQKIYWSNHLTSEDTFVWNVISSSSIATSTYTATLSNLATVVPSATVRAEVIAYTHNPVSQPDHHTQYWLNALAAPIEDAYWDGLIRHHTEVTVPTSALISGTNTLSLTVYKQPSMTSDTLYFDWFEIEYPRRFVASQDELAFSTNETGPRQYALSGFVTSTLHVLNVSDPLLPTRVLSASITSANGLYSPTFEISATAAVSMYVVGEDAIRAPLQLQLYTPPDLTGGAGADYIVISHGSLITAAHALADYRAARGLRTAVVDINDLYNEFNFGIYHPIAIKNFLRYAYDNWPSPKPAYVVLMGDGTYDPANFRGTSMLTLIPPNLAFVDPWQAQVDSSNLLVTLVGNDPLPDMLISRIPVNTLAEAQTVVNKIIAYEQSPAPRPWQRRWTLVADNIPDAAGDFVALSNVLSQTFTSPGFTADKIYLNDFGCPPGAASCPQVNYALTRTFEVTGALLVNYIGHAAIDRWASEQIYINSNVATQNNLTQLPIILSMTCLDGFWNHATTSSLMETALRAPNGGTIASWSPTGLGVASGHDSLERGFLKAVFQDGVQDLGAATLAGKLLLYSTGANFDLLHTFTILGDPALRLPTYALAASAPISARTGTPGTVVTYTLDITNQAYLTDTVTFSFAGNNWPTAANPITIPAQYGGQAVVSVTVPIDAAFNAADRVTVTIQSHGDETRATAVLTTTVGALHAAAVSSQQPTKAGDPGEPVTYTVRVENTGNVADQFNLSADGQNWQTTLTTSSVILPAQAAANVDVTVIVSPTALAGSSDRVSIIATPDGGGLNGSVTLTTTANAVYSSTLYPNVAFSAGVPGQNVVYPFNLFNSGNVTQTFDATGDSIWPLAITPTVIGPVPPWETAVFTVTTTVPITATGSATATITLIPRSGLPAPLTAHLTSESTVIHGLDLIAEPAAQSVDPGGTVTYTISLTNTGNVYEPFTIDAASTWPITLTPQSLWLLPSTTNTVWLTVTTPPQALAGSFEVTQLTALSAGAEVSATTSVTTSVNSLYSVTLAPPTWQVSAQRGEAITHTLRLTNTGNITASFQLTSAGPWPASLSSTTMGPLPPFTGEDFWFYVQAPLSASTGSTTFTITATAQGGAPPFAAAHLVVNLDNRLYLPLVRY